jgi:hypothetical protein
MANKLDSLKLQIAKPVKDVPAIGKGSAIEHLREFKDVLAIVQAVKEEGDASGRKWEIFDKDRVVKEIPELKKLKALVPAFADKVRRLITRQGVVDFIRLEQRKNKFYLVGIEKRRT